MQAGQNEELLCSRALRENTLNLRKKCENIIIIYRKYRVLLR